MQRMRPHANGTWSYLGWDIALPGDSALGPVWLGPAWLSPMWLGPVWLAV